MRLYEIPSEYDRIMDEAIDQETGEILNESLFAKLDELKALEDEKIENIGCWIKDLKASAKALKDEEEALTARRKSIERRLESLTNYLTGYLNGQKRSYPRCQLSFRSSEAVVVNCDVEQLPEAFVRVKVTKEADKTSIKNAIKSGYEIDGVTIESRLSLQIK